MVNLMIICLKGILEEGFLFNGNVNVIIDANLEFLIKVTRQKAKTNRYINQIYLANLKRFSN